MILPTALWSLDAISEREPAHYWPDGRFDDASWEDCTFDTAVAFARVVHDPDIPATHQEAERLRAASGRGTMGGTNYNDVRVAFAKRYDWDAPPVIRYWTNLRLALGTGYAAAVSGAMSAFTVNHRLRRFDPMFRGNHAALVAKLDAQPRYWWVDPLAPEGDYAGEWVTENELRAFVQAGAPGSGHLVAKLLPRPLVVHPRPLGKVVSVEGAYFEYVIHGTRTYGYDITRKRRVDHFTAQLGVSRIDIMWASKKRLFAKIVSGPREGHWINLMESTVDVI